MSLDRSVTISGTNPDNPRCAAHIVERLEQIRRDLAAMHTEIGLLQVYAGSIRDVLHYDQSYPDKRAGMVAADVQAKIGMLRDDTEALHGQVGRNIDAVTGSGVNLKTKFEWRPTR